MAKVRLVWPWVVAILVAFAGFGDVEIWPFSGLHLFSQSRGPTHSQLVFVVSAGTDSFTAAPSELHREYAKVGWLYSGRTPLTHERRCRAVFEAVERSFDTSPEAIDVVRQSYERDGLDGAEALTSTRTLDSCWRPQR